MSSTIRLLAVIEASTITGPAKNLLHFGELARPQVELSIAVFQRPGASTLFIDRARQSGFDVHVIPEKGRFDSSILAALVAHVRESAPHIVQTHAVKSHFIVRRAGIHQLLPWVAFHHGYTSPVLRARLYNNLDWWSLRAARQAITVSQPFRKDLIRKGVAPGRVAVVHNAIDPGWGAASREPAAAAALRAKLGIAPSAKVILLVGRLSREKDHQTLLAAAAQLRRGGVPEAHLLLVGDGPERARIEQTIAMLSLTDGVTLTGQVASAAPYYGIADAAVLSSVTEGSPNALLEAMAVGIPVVATKVGGIPEIATDEKSALLVAPGDREAMVRALERVLTLPHLRDSLVCESRRIILERHTPQARTARLIEIYRKL